VNPDGEWIYGWSQVSGVVDPVAAPYLGLPVPSHALGQPPILETWMGTWELLNLTICKLAGVFSTTIAPVILVGIDENNPLTIQPPAPYPTAAMPLVILPGAYMTGLDEVQQPVCKVNPDLAGDAFLVRTLWRRRQAAAAKT